MVWKCAWNKVLVDSFCKIYWENIWTYQTVTYNFCPHINYINPRSVQNVTSHFEYFKNQLLLANKKWHYSVSEWSCLICGWYMWVLLCVNPMIKQGPWILHNITQPMDSLVAASAYPDKVQHSMAIHWLTLQIALQIKHGWFCGNNFHSCRSLTESWSLKLLILKWGGYFSTIIFNSTCHKWMQYESAFKW